MFSEKCLPHQVDGRLYRCGGGTGNGSKAGVDAGRCERNLMPCRRAHFLFTLLRSVIDIGGRTESS
jgi:hypothetical protein